MAVNPVNVSRLSHNMQTQFTISTLQRNQLELFTAQSRIASGRSYVTPSEDPVAASRALDLTQALGRQNQFVNNLAHGDNMLAAADEAITEVSSLLIEAHSIASQNVGSLTSAAERSAEAELVTGIRQQLMVVGNRQFDGRYIFGGRDTMSQPFTDALGGVAYIGDTGDLFTRISDEFSAVTNVPGNLVFGALSARIASDVDLTPALSESMRVQDVLGARNEPIRAGTLIFNEVGGAGAFRVDLAEADTIGDVVRLINEGAAAAGASITATLAAEGLEIDPGGSEITIGDNSAGVVAADLGIFTNTPTDATIVGQRLNPRLTRLTPVADIARGAGLDTQNGFVVTNGAVTATVDISTAQTVQDIINAINNAGVSVMARVNDAGTGIDVFNQVSGTSLTIGENGGATAADLGIRTLDTATPLSALNFARGFDTKEGEDDLRITAQDGSTVDVNLDGAATIGDVITLLNEAATDAGVAVTASFAEVGNGIRLVDATGGTGLLSVSTLNASTAATDLGLDQIADDGVSELTSRDTNPTRTEGVIGALVDLENALRADDTQGIAAAAQRIDEFSPEVTRVHGVVGARSQAMQSKLHQTQDAVQTTEIFLSEIRDLDYAAAAAEMQSALTQLQASYQTSSVLFDLSLMNFIR